MTLPSRALILAAAVAAAACGGSPKGMDEPAPASQSAPPSAPPPPAPGVTKGVGTHHHPIRTTSKDAQAWFDEGVTLVFAFNHEEAVRAFQRAADLDPSAAMPHWGIAWALGPNYNLDIDDPRAKQAFDAVQKARTLSAGGPASERDYVEALAVRYSADPRADRPALARAYSRAMADLSRRYPDDLDAATLYAESLMNLRPWKLWDLDGAPAPDTLAIVGVLDSVLARDPNHVGANHYYIHTLEASPHPERAVASADRLTRLVPAAGHLVHMPAHIYARVGDHAGAASANAAGADADRVYLKTAPPDAFYGIAYFTHNLHFLTDSEMMQGNFEEARKAASELATALGPHVAMMPMVESMIAIQHSVLLRFGKHEDLIASAAPPANLPVETAWWHFARGVAFARTGRTADAATERAALADALGRVPDTALFGGTGLEPARTILSLATTVLDARIAAARGAWPEAVALWRRAVAAGDRVAYDEPPIWFYPLRESLGGALLQAGAAADAERAFRDDLDRHPRNGRALFGLVESLKRQGKETGWAERAFTAAWRHADSALTVEGL